MTVLLIYLIAFNRGRLSTALLVKGRMRNCASCAFVQGPRRGGFWPRDAMLARYMLWLCVPHFVDLCLCYMSVCLSVCLSVTDVLWKRLSSETLVFAGSINVIVWYCHHGSIIRVTVGPERTGTPFRFIFGQPERRSGSFFLQEFIPAMHSKMLS